MMSDLDKKLERCITKAIANYGDPESFTPVKELCNDTTEEIKQAFIDEGWNRPFDDSGIINFGTAENPILIHKDSPIFSQENGGWVGIPEENDGTVLMTGQEWYDKFEKELPADHLLPQYVNIREQVLEAAKKAAGIE